MMPNSVNAHSIARHSQPKSLQFTPRAHGHQCMTLTQPTTHAALKTISDPLESNLQYPFTKAAPHTQLLFNQISKRIPEHTPHTVREDRTRPTPPRDARTRCAWGRYSLPLAPTPINLVSSACNVRGEHLHARDVGGVVEAEASGLEQRLHAQAQGGRRTRQRSAGGETAHELAGKGGAGEEGARLRATEGAGHDVCKPRARVSLLYQAKCSVCCGAWYIIESSQCSGAKECGPHTPQT